MKLVLLASPFSFLSYSYGRLWFIHRIEIWWRDIDFEARRRAQCKPHHRVPHSLRTFLSFLSRLARGVFVLFHSLNVFIEVSLDPLVEYAYFPIFSGFLYHQGAAALLNSYVAYVEFRVIIALPFLNCSFYGNENYSGSDSSSTTKKSVLNY